MLGFSLVKPKQIRALRTRHGWTQQELAERLGTDPVTVSRWERGKSRPRPSASRRLEGLVSDLPSDLRSLIDLVGEERARDLLKRAALMDVRLPRHRFAADPTRRLREVDRALQDQLDLKARVRMQR